VPGATGTASQSAIAPDIARPVDWIKSLSYRIDLADPRKSDARTANPKEALQHGFD
jgi:hypothetical protein